MKKATKSRADLEREINELKGQLAYVYAIACNNLISASTDRLTGSGAVITISALGGRHIIDSVVIRDGLSPETIAALRNDLKRSYELATLAKPKD